MSALKFVDSHNMVAFLAKPTESEGFEQIVDFLNTNPIKYALTANPTIYTSCIEQFWATAKVKTINGDVQLHALMDKKKVIITKSIIRIDLQLEDAEGTDCLLNGTIFEQLTHMGHEKLSQKLTFYKAFFSPQWKFFIHTILQCLSAKSTTWNEFSSTMASTIICLATNQKFNFSKYIFESMVKNVDSSVKFLMYLKFVQVFLDKQVGDMSTHDKIFVTPSHTKKVFGNMKRVGKGFSRTVTPLFPTMMVQAQKEMGKEPIADEAVTEENVPTQSNDPPLSRVNTLGSRENRLTLKELMDLCTKLSDRVLDLEITKTTQAKEIASLKKRVNKLERKRNSKTPGMKRLFKISRSAQVVSSEDEGLGDQEDASKHGRKITDIDQHAEVTLVDETQGRYDDAQMFDIDVFNGEEVFVAEQSEKVVEEIVSDAATITTKVDLTLAQALVELRSAKPKVVVQEPVQSTTITTPSTIPKAKSITFRNPSESTTRTTLTPIPSNIKDKGKAKMIEPEKPLKMKEQIRLDEELAFKLQAEEDEQARLVREKAEEVEEANISWDNVQAMIEADRLLAERLQAREQEKLTDEEKARLFVELLEKRKKHFAALRAQEKRNKPPTKAQKKSTMSTYLKHMAGYKQSQLKNKSFAEIQKLFDKAMTRVNMFVDMDTELVKESSKKAEAEMAQESSSKRAGEELEQEVAKKQKMEDDKEKEDLKQCFEIVQDDEVAIDAIPLATKPAPIVNFQIHRKGRNGYYEIMRADGSAKTYLLFSQLLKEFDREDLENLWKLVKAKHGNTRPEEGYERVLWGDLKTMFEHHVEDLIWRNLQGKKVLLWRLYDSCGIHFVRFEDMHVYMLVEKRYPLTPATITDMLNKKLQADYWNEMCYQLLKLMTKQLKKQETMKFWKHPPCD
ncbi:hypothetical protein Tco_0491225 [Tanacetum coccineum]